MEALGVGVSSGEEGEERGDGIREGSVQVLCVLWHPSGVQSEQGSKKNHTDRNANPLVPVT